MKMQTYTQRLRYCDIVGLRKPMWPQQKFPELIENEKCSTPADLMGKSIDNYLQNIWLTYVHRFSKVGSAL